jgi:glucan phosphoethanolaminetransferase (alkaline phosphatase superfamily)
MESGLFFLVLGFAVFFTLFAFRNTAFRLLAMALFLGMAGVISAGYPVKMTFDSTQTIKNVQTGETWVENDTNHNVVIPGGVDSYWFAWVLGAFGFMNLIFLVREMGMMKPND